MSDKKNYLAKSKNGIDVWYDPDNSHTATHFKDTPNLDKLAIEVIEQTNIIGSYLLFHMDLGRTVGDCDLVENSPGDELVYAKRLNRDVYTPFNKSKTSQPCSIVTIAVELQDDGEYKLVSSWIGPSDSPSMPGTERETTDSKEFWTRHSLVWGSQEVQKDSITIICPW